jgi:hypothetical protein
MVAYSMSKKFWITLFHYPSQHNNYQDLIRDMTTSYEWYEHYTKKPNDNNILKQQDFNDR